MEIRMKTLLLSLLVIYAAAAAHAAGVDDPKAIALVRAMRSDEIAVSGAKRAFLSGAMAEKFPGTDARCVKRIDFADFTGGFSRVVGQVLNPVEIEAALKFYQSDAGVKYVEGTMRRLRARLGDDSGIPKIAGKEDISPKQMADIAEFTRSDLGHKVTGKDLTESPAALQFGREMLEQIAGKCARK
jgi:hypothetical protein